MINWSKKFEKDESPEFRVVQNENDLWKAQCYYGLGHYGRLDQDDTCYETEQQAEEAIRKYLKQREVSKRNYTLRPETIREVPPFKFEKT